MFSNSALDLPDEAQLFARGGYNFYEWKDYLLAEKKLRLQVPRKTNSKRAGESWLELHKSLVRKYIETTIGEISKLFPRKIHGTNLNGFLGKKSGGILCLVGKNTGNLYQINGLRLKQRYQKAGEKLDSRSIPR